MTAEVFTRGNIVSFNVIFKDADDDPIMPLSTVTLKLDYQIGDDTEARHDEQITMDVDTGGECTAEWDSSGALPGRVFWSAWSANPKAAVDGYFDLSGNAANVES